MSHLSHHFPSSPLLQYVFAKLQFLHVWQEIQISKTLLSCPKLAWRRAKFSVPPPPPSQEKKISSFPEQIQGLENGRLDSHLPSMYSQIFPSSLYLVFPWKDWGAIAKLMLCLHC